MRPSKNLPTKLIEACLLFCSDDLCFYNLIYWKFFGLDVKEAISQFQETDVFVLHFQTFHAPNFGDEEFDIPNMQPPQQQQQQQHAQQQHNEQQQQQHYQPPMQVITNPINWTFSSTTLIV